MFPQRPSLKKKKERVQTNDNRGQIMRDSFFGSSIHSVITNFLLGFTEFFKTTSWILFFFQILLFYGTKNPRPYHLPVNHMEM